MTLKLISLIASLVVATSSLAFAAVAAENGGAPASVNIENSSTRISASQPIVDAPAGKVALRRNGVEMAGEHHERPALAARRDEQHRVLGEVRDLERRTRDELQHVGVHGSLVPADRWDVD